jgi:hypothetical protein
LLDQEFRQALIAHTRGNALFCIELLRSMREYGDLVRDEKGRWKTARLVDWNRLPARIEAVVQLRISGLSSDEKQILEMASIEGQTFTAELIAHIGEQADRALIKVLSQVAKRQGHVEAANVERLGPYWLSHYKFLQAHIQQYLYANLAPRDRMFFHNEAAKFLEAVYEGRTDELALQLSWHFDQAGEPAKAIRYLAIAAKQALRLSGYREAHILLDRGLALLENLRSGPDRDELELALRIPQGAVVKALNGWAAPEIKTILDRACQLGAILTCKDETAPALFGLWAYHLVRLELDEARRIALEFLNLASTSGDDDLLIQANFSLGNTLFWLAEYDESEKFIRRALDNFDPANADLHLQRHGQDSRIFALMFLSIIGSIQDSGETETRLQNMLELAKNLNHPFSLAIALHAAAFTTHILGREDLLEQYSRELIDVTRKQNFSFYLGIGYLFHGYITAIKSDCDAGIAELEKGWGLISVGGAKILYSLYSLLLGQIHLAKGDLTSGMKDIDQGIITVETSNERVYEAELHRVKGEILARISPTLVEAARAELKIAAEIAETQGAWRFLKNIQLTQTQI